ncbi:MAG: hypothetical protein HC830_05685 [Bacteroidetes bacterium]|nr:hypothetical protein [Bacteroidota bacterium]
MENKEYIRELLEKYLEGITSKEEESFLKSYFQKENVPKEFRRKHTGLSMPVIRNYGKLISRCSKMK